MTPEAIDALGRIFEAQRSEIRVSLFARVTRFHNDTKTPTVDCQPVIAESITSVEGVRDFEALPELLKVPVMFMQAGDIYISFPMAVGNIVSVTVSSQDFAHWFVTGEDSRAEDGRNHSLDNSIAFPCGFSAGRGPVIATGAMVIAAPELRLGTATANLHLAVAELVKAELNRFAAAFDGHTHATSSGVTGTPAAAPTPTVLSPAGEVRSERVKVDS